VNRPGHPERGHPERGHPERARRRERGSGTVLVVGAIGLVLSLVVGALGVVSAVLASHRAQAAADLGALAAAGVLVRGEAPAAACALAASVAGRGGGSVASCRVGNDLRVEVVATVQATLPQLGAATARSRAGPAPEPRG
jgi:secretion/DNA translocation related TadE-like protein